MNHFEQRFDPVEGTLRHAFVTPQIPHHRLAAHKGRVEHPLNHLRALILERLKFGGLKLQEMSLWVDKVVPDFSC